MIFLVCGILYGFVFGLIPVAGVTTALITVFSFIGYFSDPMDLVSFTTGIVVASCIGDSFSSVILNIPGAGGAAASMVDGFPMTKRGKGQRALAIALSTSTLNGLIWGALVFLFLPYYADVVLYFGIPEMFSFIILAFTCVIFVASTYWFRSIIALCIGVFAGLIGQDPNTAADRYTFGWDYLGDGLQMAPVMAGVLAFPELYKAYRNRHKITWFDNIRSSWTEIWEGFKLSITYKWDSIRGGIIGAFIGAVPGIGGSVADWLAYSQTVALNPKEEFGNGNPRGLVGCEGANNAQKATSYVPTILFGIPGAPFEAVLMSLFMIVGLELGTADVLYDPTFINTITESYLLAIPLSLLVGLVFIRYAINIFKIPFTYLFWIVLSLLIWSSVQYTGLWEDYVFFAIMCILGLFMKYFKLSRAAFIIGFVLASTLESQYLQITALYTLESFMDKPLAVTLIVISLLMMIYGIFFNKQRINYV